MRKFAIFLVAATTLAGVGLAVAGITANHATPLPEPTLKVIVLDGHGSGVHVGNGFAFTAAHVVGDQTTTKVKTSDGAIDDATVLWVNKERDVALIKLAHIRPAAANLSCRTPTPGEAVEARGNPNDLEFVSTYGRVGGKPLGYAHWLNVVPLSMSVVVGQSGGPLFDANGSVVGLNVASMVAQVQIFPSFVGIGYAVPGTTLCELLAKV